MQLHCQLVSRYTHTHSPTHSSSPPPPPHPPAPPLLPGLSPPPGPPPPSCLASLCGLSGDTDSSLLLLPAGVLEGGRVGLLAAKGSGQAVLQPAPRGRGGREGLHLRGRGMTGDGSSGTEGPAGSAHPLPPLTSVMCFPPAFLEGPSPFMMEDRPGLLRRLACSHRETSDTHTHTYTHTHTHAHTHAHRYTNSSTLCHTVMLDSISQLSGWLFQHTVMHVPTHTVAQSFWEAAVIAQPVHMHHTHTHTTAHVQHMHMQLNVKHTVTPINHVYVQHIHLHIIICESNKHACTCTHSGTI